MGKPKTAGETPDNAALADIENLTDEELISLAEEKGVFRDNMDREELIQAIIDHDDPSAEPDPDEPDHESIADKAEPEKTDGVPVEASDGDIPPVGLIRHIKGVEMVNVGTAWVPTIRENVEVGKPVTVVCAKRAGKTIFAKTGKPITLDKDGKATVSAADGHYLLNIVINGKPEYTAE